MQTNELVGALAGLGTRVMEWSDCMDQRQKGAASRMILELLQPCEGIHPQLDTLREQLAQRCADAPPLAGGSGAGQTRDASRRSTPPFLFEDPALHWLTARSQPQARADAGCGLGCTGLTTPEFASTATPSPQQSIGVFQWTVKVAPPSPQARAPSMREPVGIVSPPPSTSAGAVHRF